MPADTSSVDYINKAVTDTSVVNINATGQAYQSIANSMALAVENASSGMSNFSTITQAALAKALEQYMATQDPKWADIIANLQKALTAQAASLKTIGTDAGFVMALFGQISDQNFSDVLSECQKYENSGTKS